MIHGAFFSASLNKSRTRLAPTPTNISTKSEPEIEKNGTFASPATARANNVLPVPGGPSNRTPLGIFAPIFVNLRWSFKNSTISASSCFSSSAPATSLNVTLVSPPSSFFALDFWKFITLPPPPPCICDIKKKSNPIIRINGIIFPKNDRIAPVFSAGLYSTTLSFPSLAFSFICF